MFPKIPRLNAGHHIPILQRIVVIAYAINGLVACFAESMQNEEGCVILAFI